ncbi:SMC5-SMC6 complex localization factor protein 1-like [Amphiura filiformis]|uniref:SMC5-SMC6 complex localization factor protein 1-like n=1 Tax=Amphiura filiformis TaxID=82378 RepID=UPI003B2254B8
MFGNPRRTTQRKFLLSGFTEHEKTELAVEILNLGSKYLEVGEYTADCSHVICMKPMRSEKYLCACATGKWVLSKDYITDSAKAGKWLKEEQYQWGIRHINESVGQSSMAKAPARWHRVVEETGKKSFHGWKVAIFVENKKRKPAVYKRVIECGDGKVVNARLPIKDADAMATQLTLALVDKTYESDVKSLVARGVPCVSPDFIAEHLFEEHPDMTKFLVGKQPVSCQSIVTSTVSSTRSSRRSSRANSKPTSPLKVLAVVKQERVSPPLRRVKKQTTLKFTPSVPAVSSVKAASAPAPESSVKTASPPAPVSSAKPKPVPVPVSTVKAASSTAPVSSVKAASAPATAVNTPVKSTTRATFVDLQSVNLQDVKETVVKKQARDPLSFVPYWMQVAPPKSKVGDRCAMPFPKVISNVIEACIEEGLWLQAVAIVTSNLSVSKFPPADIIHMIMQEIMKSASTTIATSGYHMLKSILCLHSPMSTPSLAQMYLQSMLPPERDIEGFVIEDDSPIRCHWDFMDRVIRNSFPSMFCPDDISKEESVKATKSQMNHQLLLKYLVSLLEQDFNGYQQRYLNSKSKKPVNCMVSSIIWPSGHHRVMTSALKHLLGHFINAVKHTQQNETMCTLLRMLATVVRMAAELLRLDNPSLVQYGVCAKDGPLVEIAYELVSMGTQDGVLDNSECIHIMLTALEPNWLKMCVSEILLQDYDDCLVLSQYKNKATESLSLEKLVHYFFYLLPRATAMSSSQETSSQESIPASPLKKTTRNPRMVKALQTLADSNHINAAGKKRKLDNVSEPKVGSPTKRRRIAQLNKRNAKGETQLHVACIKNDIPKLRQLLTSPGIQVNMTDFAGWTPLHEAANHGHINCIKEILKFKPQANIMAFLDKESKKTYGGVDLLAAPAECGTTPLHDAVQNGHLDVVRLLVQSGGKSVLMAKNIAGLTPQDLAISDEMKLALQCEKQQRTRHLRNSQGSPPNRFNSVPVNQVKGQDTNVKDNNNNNALSTSCPSEELYSTVLGSTQNPKLFVTATQADRYCLIVRHLLRAYVQTHKLIDLKAEVDRRLAVESKQRHLHTTLKESPGSFFSSPVVPTLPLVKLRDIRNKVAKREVNFNEEVLAKDLLIMNQIDTHITGFIHHVGRIGPWVGQSMSSMCSAIFLELNLLASVWQN